VRRKPGHAHAGGDFDGETRRLRTLTMRQMRGPASVSDFERSSPGLRAERASAIHAATQRVPLPLISAMEPSALCRRMRPDLGPVQAKELDAVGADAGVALAEAARESGRSWPAAASSVTMRKSLPQA
jgi:hypothetical protein